MFHLTLQIPDLHYIGGDISENHNMVEITFQTTDAGHDILLALLHTLTFDAFEEKTRGVIVTGIRDEDWGPSLQEQIDSFKAITSFTYVAESKPDQNWNAIWEASFREIKVDEFCVIRAPFHVPDGSFKYSIEIEPKMAFGTGHHETTRLMIRSMSHLDLRGKSVLDFGSGSGILAILAAKMGAARVVAIENDPVAMINLRENVGRNETDEVECILDDNLRDSQLEPVDLILANITRNVILDHLAEMVRMIHSNGLLIISGILESDTSLMVEQLEEADAQTIRKITENEWVSLTFQLK